MVFVAGLLMTVIGLLGWLNDARKEYREVEKADATGHLENIPAPRFPTGTLIVFAVLFVGSLLIAGGVIPPRGGTSGGGSAASSARLPRRRRPRHPGALRRPPAAPSAAPSGGSGGATVSLKLTAQGIAYDTDTLEVPANTPFQIVFTNNDAGIPHNVAIHKDSPTGPARLGGRHLQRGGDADLRRPGPPRRDLRLRLHGPPQHDRHPHREVGGARRPGRGRRRPDAADRRAGASRAESREPA